MQIRERQASLDRASSDLNPLDSIWPKLFNLDPHISLEAASFLEIRYLQVYVWLPPILRPMPGVRLLSGVCAWFAGSLRYRGYRGCGSEGP
jgi:hypothetical protein